MLLYLLQLWLGICWNTLARIEPSLSPLGRVQSVYESGSVVFCAVPEFGVGRLYSRL